MTRDVAFEDQGRLAAPSIPDAPNRTAPASKTRTPHTAMRVSCCRGQRVESPRKGARMTRTTRTTRITGTTRTTRRLPAVLAAVAIMAALLAAGCSPQAEPQAVAPEVSAASVTYPVTITDDASRSVTVAAEPTRIVSLAPANTEILFAVGAGDRLVGVTTYDDYPAEVADIAKMGDFAGPNIEAIAAADPDVIFVTTGVQADMIVKLEELGATVIAIDPLTLEGVYEDVTEVAQVVNRVEQGEEVVAAMKAQVAEVQAAVGDVEPVAAFVEIAQNPLFTAGKGTLLDELITLAGGRNVVTEAGWVPYSSEQVIKADPQVYMATLGSMSDPAELEKRAGFKDLSAVKNGRVVVLDDNLVSRPGPRIVEGLKLIAAALHPDAFDK